MTPQACLTCTHWKPHRPSADWGTCLKLAGIESAEQNKAYLKGVPECDLCLHTHKSFYCSLFEQKPSHPRNIVDCAVDASRTAAGLPPFKR